MDTREAVWAIVENAVKDESPAWMNGAIDSMVDAVCDIFAEERDKLMRDWGDAMDRLDEAEAREAALRDAAVEVIQAWAHVVVSYDDPGVHAMGKSIANLDAALATQDAAKEGSRE